MERGTVRTSAIVIATGERTVVFRTLEEVPPALRRKLVKSTGGSNCATVLIADRRGAEELLKAQRAAEAADAAGAFTRGLARRAKFALRLLCAHWLELLLSGALGLLLWLLFAART